VPNAAGGETMRTMRAVDSPEQHFTEGEPDIEPPEELAVTELDDVALLEEELDNEDVLEQDVEEDVLEETLEDLVHLGEGDEGEEIEAEAPVGLLVPSPEEAEEDLERGDDVEEGLDLILEHRLALAEERVPQAKDEELAEEVGAPAGARMGAEEDVRPRGPGEFTCRSCFLVHSLELLADEVAMVCRDCAS